MPARLAVVSAAASGIGLAIARGLIEDDWEVVGCDSDPAAIDALGDEPGLELHQADVSKPGDVEALFAAVSRRGVDGIDLLVNNAGIAGPTARLEEVDFADWQRTLAVNLDGMFLMTRAAIPLLRSRAPGSGVVNMGSNAGLFGCPLRAPYVASKWAIVGLTKTLAMELGPEGIRVNAICPGSVAGPRIERVIAADARARGVEAASVEAEYKRQSSLRRFTESNEIAGMVRFLISPAGQGISGQALSLDEHTEGLWLDL